MISVNDVHGHSTSQGTIAKNSSYLVSLDVHEPYSPVIKEPY